jgi:hypothetical protein
VPNAVGAFDYATIHIEGAEPTDVENITSEMLVTKILSNQQVILLQGNMVYTMTGQMLE